MNGLDTWKECLDCKGNCCCMQKQIVYPLFLTEKERRKFPGINDTFPCKFLSESRLCLIYKKRPIDCRLFPFDIVEENGIFYWVYWNTDCPITKMGYANEWEIRLKNAEKKLLPCIKKYLHDYSNFRIDEFIKNFGKYVILREIQMK
jgi:Fe-S-cluster containining protein